jgi:hypothetical protein
MEVHIGDMPLFYGTYVAAAENQYPKHRQHLSMLSSTLTAM